MKISEIRKTYLWNLFLLIGGLYLGISIMINPHSISDIVLRVLGFGIFIDGLGFGLKIVLKYIGEEID